ncbi:alpha-2,8-polysialyltransferase family protein [Streptomyces sp. NBC_00083]|uniref:alpha-2,8-polysialyltransferase family protein n=1 Tax=Streptomyces sp. NBC_00083 TaxID=2975647 RepID=UPI00224F2FE1|nr:alpha-2,8-polysialyltransferase family protein [Streptomyces sp. NBC_00083]MCX5385206.1 alpha-2,8-polysialyltransferase family protein [Streptomyces sp. NBC_00083]
MGTAPGPRTTQIFAASTLYGVATLAAALDSGCFPAAGRRLLLLSNNAYAPETSAPLDALSGFERLRGRFDGVLSWNDTIAPFHPAGWSPRADDAPLWERQLRTLWELGDDRVELALESIQVNPAQAVAQLFPDAPITVYADGLMTYGPTRNKLDPLIGGRARRVLHLDLVPGLAPLLLGEFGVPSEPVPTAAFLKVVSELGVTATELEVGGDGEPIALLLGQYLSALSILTPEQEEELHLRMVRGAAARGHRRLVFKPHPSAPAAGSEALVREATALGVHLTVLDSPLLAEVLYERLSPALVVGCFSTALLTASAFYGLPVARVGTELLLDRLAPYQNSNRVPVTIADALLPPLEAGPDAPSVDLPGLLGAVGYAMQPELRPDLRGAAERYLAGSLDAHTWRYFKRRRLTVLGLPGAVPARLGFVPRNATVRRIARRARALTRNHPLLRTPARR